MQTLVNFRDIGGIKTRDGGIIKRKRMLRSGEVVNINENDKEILLSEYRLNIIFDFRDDMEVTQSPDDRLEGVEYFHIDIMKDVNVGSTSKENFIKKSDVKKAQEEMKKIYRDIILNKTSRAGYHNFIKKMASVEKGAVLFHCFAGKDRTGIGAALLLSILGASRDDIFEDYLKTNAQRKIANEQIFEEARKKGMDERQITVLNSLMTVNEEYLQCMFDVINENYGTTKKYVEEGLLLTPKIVDQLKDLYVS